MQSSACGEENRRIACACAEIASSTQVKRDALNVCFLTKSRRQNWFLANCQVFGVSLLFTGISTSTHAYGVEQVCDYTDRQTVSPLTDLTQNFIRTYIHDDKTVYEILSI
ncbi:hypothetical protein AVEN_131325-1 [Araneus ventricosus]|uniref:Uncharacterized protein n=1 Tax=Araneus ventricosus TaxID=182803 RepID=A0A4Y1ZPF5_ARAVE|nr:hypothetical protein AVEN_131325-1 [Araneus ventricosus]